MAKYSIQPFDRLVNERHDELGDFLDGRDDEALVEILQKNDAALKAEIGRIKALYGKVKMAPVSERLRACELARDTAVYAEKLHAKIAPDPRQQSLGDGT